MADFEVSTTFDVIPPEIDIASTANIPLTFDITPWRVAGDSPTTPTAKLIREPQRTEYVAGIGSVAYATNIITVRLVGLEPKQSYFLLVSIELAVNKKFTGVLRVNCPV